MTTFLIVALSLSFLLNIFFIYILHSLYKTFGSYLLYLQKLQKTYLGKMEIEKDWEVENSLN
jgi:hypothetical protein